MVSRHGDPVHWELVVDSRDTEKPSGTERFDIQRRLGVGGMGIVYEAYDRERQSVVALKTLRRLEASTLYHFKKEAGETAL